MAADFVKNEKVLLLSHFLKFLAWFAWLFLRHAAWRFCTRVARYSLLSARITRCCCACSTWAWFNCFLARITFLFFFARIAFSLLTRVSFFSTGAVSLLFFTFRAVSPSMQDLSLTIQKHLHCEFR